MKKSVTADPNKTDYEYGDSFDNTGMEVTAYYNDGNSATVTDYVVGADIIKIIGEVTITVEYGGMSAVTTINVAQRQLSVIDIVAVDRAYDGFVGTRKRNGNGLRKGSRSSLEQFGIHI